MDQFDKSEGIPGASRDPTISGRGNPPILSIPQLVFPGNLIWPEPVEHRGCKTRKIWKHRMSLYPMWRRTYSPEQTFGRRTRRPRGTWVRPVCRFCLDTAGSGHGLGGCEHAQRSAIQRCMTTAPLSRPPTTGFGSRIKAVPISGPLGPNGFLARFMTHEKSRIEL